MKLSKAEIKGCKKLIKYCLDKCKSKAKKEGVPEVMERVGIEIFKRQLLWLRELSGKPKK